MPKTKKSNSAVFANPHNHSIEPGRTGPSIKTMPATSLARGASLGSPGHPKPLGRGSPRMSGSVQERGARQRSLAAREAPYPFGGVNRRREKERYNTHDMLNLNLSNLMQSLVRANRALDEF